MVNDLTHKVITELLSVPPLLFRKVRRKMKETYNTDIDKNISQLTFEIIKLLSEEGSLRVAETGNKLNIAKAQMTQLVDKLVKLKLVERHADAEDRRAIKISLTEKGKIFIEERENNLIESIQESLTSLTEQELEELYNALSSLRRILSKL